MYVWYVCILFVVVDCTSLIISPWICVCVCGVAKLVCKTHRGPFIAMIPPTANAGGNRGGTMGKASQLIMGKTQL